MNQTYLLRKLVTNQGAIDLDELGLQAQLIPQNKEWCLILTTDPTNALEGAIDLLDHVRIGSAKVSEIRYTLSGTGHDSETIYEEFKHTFTTPVHLQRSGPKTEWPALAELVTEGNALFIPYQLDVLLGTKNKFPKVTAVQFIA